jgi:hypothetical protein
MRRLQHGSRRGAALIEVGAGATQLRKRLASRYTARNLRMAARVTRASQRASLPSTRAVRVHRYIASLCAMAMARAVGLALLGVLSTGQIAPAVAAANQSEATLIVKIGKFVHWPAATFANSGGVLRLCILGTGDDSGSIDSLAGQKLQDKVIAIAQLAHPDPSVAKCHIVFVRKSERDRLAAVLQATARSPVLTISDIDGFAAAGGMIGFSNIDGAVHFEINVAASKRAGLSIGAQLLQIAALSTNEHAGAGP